MVGVSKYDEKVRVNREIVPVNGEIMSATQVSVSGCQ